MFDSYGNRVQAGFREDITDFTFVYEDRFVTVNDDQVSIDYVTPSVEVLDCYTDSNEIAGLSKGAMEIEGICGQYKEGNINY